MMRIELSRFVEGDLDVIATIIAQDNPVRALSFIREIRADPRDRAESSPLPFAARTWRGCANGDCRTIRDPIPYYITEEVVRIERVVYGGRDLLALFQPEP